MRKRVLYSSLLVIPYLDAACGNTYLDIIENDYIISDVHYMHKIGYSHYFLIIA